MAVVLPTARELANRRITLNMHDSPPPPQFAVKLLPSDSYLKPEASTYTKSSIGYAYTSEVQQAAAFKTQAEARKFWDENSSKFSGTNTVTIVKVEKVKEIKNLEAKPTLNAVETDLFYVLTRPTNSLGGGSQASSARFVTDIGYTNDVSMALCFGSVSAALIAAMARQKVYTYQLDINNIEAFRKTATWSFKITEIERIETGEFQIFEGFTSSVVRQIAYDPNTRALRITLKRAGKAFGVNGERMEPDSTYQYSNVDAKDVFAFLAAKSKGSYYSRIFKAKYDRGARKV